MIVRASYLISCRKSFRDNQLLLYPTSCSDLCSLVLTIDITQNITRFLCANKDPLQFYQATRFRIYSTYLEGHQGICIRCCQICWEEPMSDSLLKLDHSKASRHTILWHNPQQLQSASNQLSAKESTAANKPPPNSPPKSWLLQLRRHLTLFWRVNCSK